jgi:serine protease inhibitor
MTEAGPAVRALTAAWLRDLPLGRNTVVSGAGLWPLLGLLAGAADGLTRDELAAAVGLEPEAAADAAGALLAALDASPDIAAASGTWVRPGIPLDDWWRAHVPADSIGELTSQAALDAWAREHTDGLIKKMPVTLTPKTAILIASALLLRTTWQVPFMPSAQRGRTWLRRTTTGVDDVRTVAGPVTVVTVRGEQDVDVLLAMGTERAAPAEVLAALLMGALAASGTELLDSAVDAPGMAIRTVTGREPTTALTVPAFEVRSTHNLLERADVFGLRSACAIGGFPRLSPAPLQVSDAAQEVMARFFATGFVAAAVTGVAMAASARQQDATAKQLIVTFDRPFGFAAIHRPTGVPVVAGWIADVA